VSFHCRVAYSWDALTEEDKQWIGERLEKVETALLAEFHKRVSPFKLGQHLEDSRGTTD
jgi:hypothetical protein